MASVQFHAERPLLGAVLKLQYPAHNRFDVPLEFSRVSFRVVAIRDCGFLPLSPGYILRHPMERLGRTMLTGLFGNETVCRRLWLEAHRGGELPSYRLGLVDPSRPGELVDWVEDICPPTLDGRKRLNMLTRKWLRILRDADEQKLKLAAYSGNW